jgi:CDGSH-type Zn-finger protein
MTIIRLLVLAAVVILAVYLVRKHLAEVAAEQQAKHVHRPIVVMDGSVDLCSCGELVNR